MKRTKARRDIKSKLIAAICMLMVSVIMLASSSYAWFTLSTAPEVKGIQTSVGANGNLEIALLSTKNTFTDPKSISSAVATSSAVVGVKAANVTWGNLVDVSDEAYGLSKITLMPAELNGTLAVGSTIAAQMLKVPTYGADGRVVAVKGDNTILAPYDSTKQGFVLVDTTKQGYDPAKTIEYGVRGVGVSTSRSQREVIFDTNMSQAAQAASIAKSNAAISLQSYGEVLANVGIQGAMAPDSTFSRTDLGKLQSMINSITGYYITVGDGENTNREYVAGIVDNLTDALKYFAIAAVASAWNEDTYASDEEFVTAMQALQNNPAAAYGMIGTLGDDFTAALDELAEILTVANAAQAKLDVLANSDKTTFTVTEIKTVVAELFTLDGMKVCGMTIDEILADGGKEDLMDAYGEYNNNILVDMNGGIYSEIADLAGKFSGKTEVTIPDFGTPDAIMQANKAETGVADLSSINTKIASKPAPKGTSDVQTISDAYGYVIDLAFRTNASGSDLRLQTAAEARIDGADAETMGGGSTMSFTISEGFTVEKMQSLMGKIKVVFFKNDGTNEIVAIAGVDTADPATTVTGSTVTAPLKIVKDSGFATQAQAKICALSANTEVKISALVYLDGTQVTNADVGTGALSMYGSLNLQFSSSATLLPMDYSAGYAAPVTVTEPAAG